MKNRRERAKTGVRGDQVGANEDRGWNAKKVSGKNCCYCFVVVVVVLV
jgi:hypothetical protein